MKATVYTTPGCDVCEREIALLRAEGYEVEVIDTGGFPKGIIPAHMDKLEAADVMAQLTIQGGAFPVTRINGEFKRRAG
jgi:glutaredoxin